jgi:hypothetical protein
MQSLNRFIKKTWTLQHVMQNSCSSYNIDGTGQAVPVHVIKVYGGVDMKLQLILIFTINGGEWLASCGGCKDLLSQ